MHHAGIPDIGKSLSVVRSKTLIVIGPVAGAFERKGV